MMQGLLNPEEKDACPLTNFPSPRPIAQKPRCSTGMLSFLFFLLGSVVGAAAMLTGLALFTANSSLPPPSANDTNTTQFGCSLQKDVQILLTMGSSFLDEQSKCGRANLGVASTTAICLEKATHVSPQCGTVYGQLTACGKNNCMFECFNGASKKCAACVCKHCRAVFLQNMKIPCTLIPNNVYSCNDCPGHLSTS
jgi:hypothetical protein